MYNILVSGYYGFNNIGDEAVLRSVVETLRKNVDGIDITILSKNPADTESKYNVRAVPRMNIFGIIKAIRHCDMLISGGGSLLQDVTSKISILYYLFIIRAALLMGKKVFIYSQGIGPINSRINRFLTSRFLRRVHGIAVRDKRSAEFLESIGIDREKINVTADPVLRLEKADLAAGDAILRSAGCDPKSGRTLVGWAIKDSRPSAAFIAEIEKCIRWLKSEYNADSVLIPFFYEQDSKIISELSSHLGSEVCCISRKYLSDEMASIIGNLDLLVGVRLHSLIYASVMDVASIGISYDPKVDAFLESIGQSAVSSVSDFTFEKFRDAYTDARQNREERISTVREKVDELITSLETNDNIVKNIIDGEHPEASEKSKKSGGIATAIGGVMLVTLVAKVFAILRESVQANVFGAADAFYSSYNKTIYLFTTAAYAMCVAAVPIITKELAADRKRGFRAANNLTTFALLLSLIGAAIMEILTLPALSGFAYGAAGTELIPFIRIMILSLPIIVGAYLMVSTFQSMDHFALQGSMSLPYSVLLIGYLVLFGKKLPLLAYVIMVAIAWVLQLLMSVPYGIKEKYIYKPTLDLKQDYIGLFVKTAVVTIVTSSMYLFCYLIDASRAGRLGEGITSAFYYADKLFTPLTTTFIYSISAVMFPKFNRTYTQSGKREYLGYVWGITSSTLLIVFPVSALLMVFGGDILKVLFESGNFTAETTAETTRIFFMYVIGMAGFSVMDLLSKAFFTMKNSLVPLIISLGVIAANFVLDLIFGSNGSIVALSTALSMTVGAVVTVIIMFRNEKGLVKLVPAAKSLISSVAVGVVCYFLRGFVVNGGEGKIMLIVKCGVVGVVGLIVFVAFSFILKNNEITSIVKHKKGA